VILTDVSLSVRATARFTLHLVHGLQSLFGQVRTFAFVSDLAEVTDLFADHPVEQALGLIFGGDVLDVDANSDYGAAFGRFHEDFGSAVNRRSTVLVLGDGRGNGNDPNVEAFTEITRRARETIWLTPEPRYSWGWAAATCPSTPNTARACGWCATSPAWRARRRRWRPSSWGAELPEDVQLRQHAIAIVQPRVTLRVDVIEDVEQPPQLISFGRGDGHP
jgi:VWA domain containing CoxE-like protein